MEAMSEDFKEKGGEIYLPATERAARQSAKLPYDPKELVSNCLKPALLITGSRSVSQEATSICTWIATSRK